MSWSSSWFKGYTGSRRDRRSVDGSRVRGHDEGSETPRLAGTAASGPDFRSAASAARRKVRSSEATGSWVEDSPGSGRPISPVPASPQPLGLMPLSRRFQRGESFSTEGLPLPLPRLQVTRNPDWRRLKNRSAEADMRRESDPNASRLMESQHGRTVFYDPRKPKHHHHLNGNLEDLKNHVVKYTRVESCSKKDDVKKVERDVFHIELLNRIGRGGYGEVYIAKRVGIHQTLAVKVYNTFHENLEELDEENFLAQKARDELVLSLHEIIVMRILQGEPFFAQLIDHFIINDRIYIVMELESGTLNGQLSLYPDGMPENKVRKWFFQMAQGLAHMHRIGIAHMDLKTDNVLIRKLSDGSTICKWTDFGLALFLPNCHKNIRGWISAERDAFRASSRTQPLRDIDFDKKGRLRNLWTIGEIHLEEGTDADANDDIFKMGSLIMIPMLALPEDDANVIPASPQEKFLSDEIQSGHLPLSREVKSLLWSLLQVEPTHQITAKQLVRHPWFFRSGFVDPGFHPVQPKSGSNSSAGSKHSSRRS